MLYENFLNKYDSNIHKYRKSIESACRELWNENGNFISLQYTNTQSTLMDVALKEEQAKSWFANLRHKATSVE